MATKCLKDGTRCWKGNYMLKESTVNVILTCKYENWKYDIIRWVLSTFLIKIYDKDLRLNKCCDVDNK